MVNKLDFSTTVTQFTTTEVPQYKKSDQKSLQQRIDETLQKSLEISDEEIDHLVDSAYPNTTQSSSLHKLLTNSDLV